VGGEGGGEYAEEGGYWCVNVGNNSFVDGEGLRVFFGRGNCRGCHVEEGIHSVCRYEGGGGGHVTGAVHVVEYLWQM